MKRLAKAAAPIAAVAVSAALYQGYRGWQHWLAYETGSRNTPGTPPNYNYWSGFGSVWPWSTGVVVSVLALAVHHYLKANCHRKGCWRIGHYDFTDDTAGITYKLCKHCHPRHHGEPLTKELIHTIHADNLAAPAPKPKPPRPTPARKPAAPRPPAADS